MQRRYCKKIEFNITFQYTHFNKKINLKIEDKCWLVQK